MNKKGVSRSLLSATKRWFVTNKPGVNTMQNAVVYTNDSIELQTRKLGDLYFMFGNYNLAFQVSFKFSSQNLSRIESIEALMPSSPSFNINMSSSRPTTKRNEISTLTQLGNTMLVH